MISKTTLPREAIKFRDILCISMVPFFVVVATLLANPARVFSATDEFDLVINHGRVIDPERKLDALRHVGIRGERIVLISESPLSGERVIDASGLVVAPGFIDTHVHGQTQFGSKLMLRDGVTTTLDMEVGGINLKGWYDQRQNRWQTNYGVTVSHEYVRMVVLDELSIDGPADAQLIGPLRTKAELSDGVAGYALTVPTEAQLQQIIARVDSELRQGGLGLGTTIGYMINGVSTREMWELQKLAASYGRGTFSHVRFLGNNLPPNEGTLGFTEAFGNALALGAPFMALHDNNRGWQENEEKLATARARGMNAWSEYYPYISGSGPIGSEFLRPETFLKQWEAEYETSLLDPATGEFFTQASYEAKRARNPGYMIVVILHSRKAWLTQWLHRPHATVGSDGMPTTDIHGETLSWNSPYEDFVGHPRTAGSHARVLRLGRENDVSLMQSISQLSYWAALHLGNAGVEAMRQRGRVQQGMIADLTIFDPHRVTDNATHQAGHHGLPSTGIPYVIVNGTVVVDESKVQPKFPGQPIRYTPVVAK